MCRLRTNEAILSVLCCLCSVSEEVFWRNYFYRVGLIRQSTELSSLEQKGTDEKTTTDAPTTKGTNDTDHALW